MPRLWSCSVAVILPQHPTSSHADAGVVIASHLPKWKNLRKVKMCNMNPVPILWCTVSCGNLAEVVIVNPKHCKVSFPELSCPCTHRGMLLDRPTLVQCGLLLTLGTHVLQGYSSCVCVHACVCVSSSIFQ